MYGMNLMGGVGLFAMRSGGGGSSEPAHTLPEGAVADWNAESLALADGAPVNSWTDSVAGINATGRGTTKPTYVANAMGGKPGVRLDPAQNQDFNAGLPTPLVNAFGSQQYTVVVVTANIGTAPSGIGTLFASQANAVDGVLVYADGAKAGRYTYYRAYSGANQLSAIGYTGQVGTTLSPTSGTPRGTTRHYINGSCTSCYRGVVPTYKTTGFFVGSRNGALFANATILRVLVWARPLKPHEMLQLQYHLEGTYKQTVARPNKFLIFDGDSLSGGFNTYANDEWNYPNIVASELGLPFGSWTIAAVPGTTSGDMRDRASYELDPIIGVVNKPTVIAAFEWYNAFSQGTLTTAAMRTYAADRKAAGHKIVMGTSTSAFDDGAERASFNADFDSNNAAFDGYVPIHNNTKIGVNGAAAADASPGPRVYYAADGLHFTGAAGASGNRELAAVMKPTIASLMA